MTGERVESAGCACCLRLVTTARRRPAGRDGPARSCGCRRRARRRPERRLRDGRRHRPALGLVARRPGPGRGRCAPRGRRPRRRRGHRARRGRAGVAPRAVGEGGPPGRPRLPPLRLGEDREAAADPLARYPTAGRRDALDGVLPLHEPLPGRGRRRGTGRSVETTSSSRPRPTDRVRLDLGRNGTATGTRLVRRRRRSTRSATSPSVIPLERVRWEGPAFRYEDRGWIFVHVEGAPYARGRQYGKLVADEIVAYIHEARRSRRDAEGPARGLGRPAHAGRRPHAARLRRGVPRGDEGHRRRRRRGGGARSTAASVDLLDVVTMNSVDRPRTRWRVPSGDAERRSPGGASSRPRTSSTCPSASTSARRFAATGPGHRRRPARLRPDLHVGRLHRRPLQRDARRRARRRATAS